MLKKMRFQSNLGKGVSQELISQIENHYFINIEIGGEGFIFRLHSDMSVYISNTGQQNRFACVLFMKLSGRLPRLVSVQHTVSQQ